MINFNGTIQQDGDFALTENRGLKFGDAVFETIKVVQGKVLFFEDHYFRLMASMRMIRMDIPMSFTPEFIEQEIKDLVANNESNNNARVRLTVFRKSGGLYTPQTNDIDYIIETKPLLSEHYLLSESAYEIELFKDYYITPQILSTLKTNNRVINVIGSVFAKENNYDNCLLLNSDKSVVEALNGNVFLVKGNKIRTPRLEDGCIKGVLRKQLIEIISQMPDLEIEEAAISPFELQKADEIFITNVISGIQPVTKYRKKTYGNTVAKDILAKLNVKVRLS